MSKNTYNSEKSPSIPIISFYKNDLLDILKSDEVTQFVKKIRGDDVPFWKTGKFWGILGIFIPLIIASIGYISLSIKDKNDRIHNSVSKNISRKIQWMIKAEASITQMRKIFYEDNIKCENGATVARIPMLVRRADAIFDSAQVFNGVNFIFKHKNVQQKESSMNIFAQSIMGKCNKADYYDNLLKKRESTVTKLMGESIEKDELKLNK